MKNILWLVFVVYVCDVSCQVVNRVRVKNHRAYIANVIQETIYTLEERQWCNLRLPDVTISVNETIFGKEYLGNATYKNGFLISIQDVAIRNASINQNFVATADGTVRVTVTGELRLIDAAIGYDVVTDFAGTDTHHYTAAYTHPLLTYMFTVIRNATTQEMGVTVVGDQPDSRNIVRMLPRDNISDALTSLFNVGMSKEGVVAWADIIQPIALDVITHRVPFPGFCYNCPVTA
ncbi:uncharacterized protein LOC126375317 [Pectinophora gossypiella]|uniref:uncharacterized protein LOC126375317 n=1 Tax=Pectinophora gossypiella TaxID=13191 RepID=UPI00214EE883|nr:uncharacterized protein LOC126375317 [Pectinophora gossypiella]